jgi:hypothetical protein
MKELDALIKAYIDECHAMGRYQPSTPYHISHREAAVEIMKLIKYLMER